MSEFMFYAVATGEILPGVIHGAIAPMAPPGMGLVSGGHDHLCRRVDLATGKVVPWQPPAPPDDPMCAWSWDESAERWVASPTAAAVAAKVRAARDELMRASDWVVSRAVELGEPVPEAWRTYRQALRDVPGQAGFPESVEWPVRPST